MRREEAAAMLPEPRPDALAISLRNVQTIQRGAREELKAPLAHRRRELFQFRLQLEQEHQPVGLALETVFADEAGEMEVRREKFLAEFLVRFAGRANVGRFAFVGVEFAAARTPEAAIRLLRAFEQEDVIALVKTIEQRGDFVRQLHVRSFAVGPHGSSVLSELRVCWAEIPIDPIAGWARVVASRTMNIIINKSNWMPKHAAWLRPVAKAHLVDGGRFSP
jgi:hypothetical protein